MEERINANKYKGVKNTKELRAKVDHGWEGGEQTGQNVCQRQACLPNPGEVTLDVYALW